MKKTLHILILLSFSVLIMSAHAQNDTIYVETQITLKTSNGDIYGTLTTPKDFKKIPVALIIAGSGPTDRNGNNSMMKNNSLKKLAYELSKKGIATLRYDKRGIAGSVKAGINEFDLRFENYIKDAKEWIQLLKQDNRFSQVIVIGHSEGSLIGMVASAAADKYVSVAGAGRSADIIIKEQLGNQPKIIQDLSFPIIDSLKSGYAVKKVPPMIATLFRPSVQPYIISWFKYDPEVLIKQVTIPTLIIQGTNDIQVSIKDAEILSHANPNARLVLINNMNHIFRIVEGDRQANMVTYSNENLPIAEELATSISDFILNK